MSKSIVFGKPARGPSSPVKKNWPLVLEEFRDPVYLSKALLWLGREIVRHNMSASHTTSKISLDNIFGEGFTEAHEQDPGIWLPNDPLDKYFAS